jgi:hypothetical protein
MTGKPDYNRPLFKKAAERLYEMGAVSVFNPGEAWIAFDTKGWTHENYMLGSLNILTRRSVFDSGDMTPVWDMVVTIGDFYNSDGAIDELVVAESIGIEVYTDIAVFGTEALEWTS